MNQGQSLQQQSNWLPNADEFTSTPNVKGPPSLTLILQRSYDCSLTPHTSLSSSSQSASHITNQNACTIHSPTTSLMSTPYLPPSVATIHTALLTVRSCLQTLGTPQMNLQCPPTTLCLTTMSHCPHSWPLRPSPSSRPLDRPPSHSALHLQKPINDTLLCRLEQPQGSLTVHGPTTAPTTNPYPHKMRRTYSSSKKTSVTLSTPPPMASSPLSTVTWPSSTTSFEKSTNRSWHSETSWPNMTKSSSTFEGSWETSKCPLGLNPTRGESPTKFLTLMGPWSSPTLSNN